MKLNKKVLASVIAAGILTTGTALANPFDDVPKGHWAYDAVQSLADQGIVDGFGDGTYRGEKLMTRYEMAQIVARAMSLNKGTENPTLNKLSAEYADELSSLGVKVASLEKKTAGVNDLKISHWFETENTYGDDYDDGGDLHEYELEYRLTAEKQVSDKLSMLMQIETKTYWDGEAAVVASGGADGVYTRLAYLTYKPNDKVTIEAGKNAHWLAGGLLGDDYLKAINITAKLDDKTTFQAIHGRYWLQSNVSNGMAWTTPEWSVNPDTGDFEVESEYKAATKKESGQINYLGLNTKFGVVDFGAHYMFGQHGLTMADRESKIWAVTAGADIAEGLNLSVGYAENTEEDDDNTLTKVQLFKKLGKVDTFLQYWNQEGNYNPLIENGNHMAWWGHQYGGKGVEGFRLILGYPVSANCYATGWYGSYDTSKDGVDNDDSATKFGWALTFSY